MSIIEEYVSDAEAQEEEEWLDICRRKGVYNGPAGGPPGLQRDKPYDPHKAVRFRRLCKYIETQYPELKCERNTSKSIDEDLIYSLANDYLDIQEFINNSMTERNSNKYYNLVGILEHFKELRIKCIARGLNNSEIKTIITREKAEMK